MKNHAASHNSAASPALIIAAFLAMYLIWGSTYYAIAVAIKTMPPFLMGAVRFLAAGFVLYVVARLTGAAPARAIHWRNASVAGILMLCGGTGAAIWVEQTASSGMTALLISTAPVFFTLIEWLIMRGPRPSALTTFGLGVGLFGLFLLVNPFGDGANASIGALESGLVILGTLCWTSGSMFARHNAVPDSVYLFTAMEMLAGGLGFLVLAGLNGEYAIVDWGAVSTESWLAVAYLAVFGSIIALSAFVYLMQVSTPTKVSTYTFVNPIIALFLGAALGSERVTQSDILVALAILSAVAMIIYSNRAKAKA